MAKSLSEVVADTSYMLTIERPAALLPDPGERSVFCPVISVDDHVLEPADIFDRVPANLRDRAPHLVRGDRNRPLWVIDGQTYPIGGTNGAAGRPMTEWNAYSLDFNEFRRGVYDVDARIDDMDGNGVWASLNFPSIPWGFAGRTFFAMRDPEVGLACLRAYNDWVLEDWCGSHPSRFIPCQISWMADPEIAAADIRRNAERGFRCVSFSENPEGLGLPSIYSPTWDPFFAACEETETVVNLHVGSSGTIHQPSTESPREARVALFPVNGIETLIDWLFARIPTRFPNLKIVLSEAGVSWVPMAMERISKVHGQAAVTGDWRPDDPDPIELVHRNFYFTSIEDPSAFRLLDIIGEDKVMVEVDYPHGDSTWPNTQELLRRDLASLERSVVEQVCFRTAAALYRHPLPPADRIASATFALQGGTR